MIESRKRFACTRPRTSAPNNAPSARRGRSSLSTTTDTPTWTLTRSGSTHLSGSGSERLTPNGRRKEALVAPRSRPSHTSRRSCSCPPSVAQALRASSTGASASTGARSRTSRSADRRTAPRVFRSSETSSSPRSSSRARLRRRSWRRAWRR